MIAAIISTDAGLRSRLEAALQGVAGVDSVLIIPAFPSTADIRSLEGRPEQYIAFLDCQQNMERAIALAGEINRSCPSINTIAVNVGSSQADLIAVVRAGVRDVLPQAL